MCLYSSLYGESLLPVSAPQEEKLKEYRREQKKARKRKERGEEEDDLEAEVDPEMEAMMGFSGFGAKKKKA